MALPRWVGDHRYRLLNWSVPELQKMYTGYSRSAIKSAKHRWTQKLKEGKITMPPKPEGSPEKSPVVDGQLYKTWEVSAFNRDTNKWETTTNHGYDYAKDRNVDDLFPQVEASRITPTRRKRMERIGALVLGYGDGQVDFRLIRNPRTAETQVVPIHNVPMHRIILRMNAYYMPERTINGGDMGDFAGSSRFPPDSDHFTGSTTLAMQWIHDFYSQIVADNPNAKFGGTAIHSEVASNHADRPRKKILRDMPELYNFYRPGEDYPAHTYYSMARLQELGIDHTSGYPHGEIITGEDGYPQVLWKHGSITGKNAVYNEADRNPTINVIRWHNHGERLIKRTTREGQQLFYQILGSSCLNGGPVSGYNSAVDDFNQPVSYHNQDHVNSFIMHRDYGKGRYENVTIDVVNGKAYYDGREWDGSEPFEWERKYGYIKDGK